MASILFTWELGGGLGHLLPLRALSRALAGRGHRITLAARDVGTASRLFEGEAVAVVQAPERSRRPTPFLETTRSFGQILHNIGFGEAEMLTSLAPAAQMKQARTPRRSPT